LILSCISLTFVDEIDVMTINMNLECKLHTRKTLQSAIKIIKKEFSYRVTITFVYNLLLSVGNLGFLRICFIL